MLFLVTSPFYAGQTLLSFLSRFKTRKPYDACLGEVLPRDCARESTPKSALHNRHRSLMHNFFPISYSHLLLTTRFFRSMLFENSILALKTREDNFMR